MKLENLRIFLDQLNEKEKDSLIVYLAGWFETEETHSFKIAINAFAKRYGKVPVV